MEKDPLVREVLGDHIYNKFLEMKYKEWRDYSTRVTNWEIDRYLNVF